MAGHRKRPPRSVSVSTFFRKRRPRVRAMVGEGMVPVERRWVVALAPVPFFFFFFRIVVASRLISLVSLLLLFTTLDARAAPTWFAFLRVRRAGRGAAPAPAPSPPAPGRASPDRRGRASPRAPAGRRRPPPPLTPSRPGPHSPRPSERPYCSTSSSSYSP